MFELNITFTSNVWLYTGANAAWHFASLPPKDAQQIKRLQHKQVGFGSVRVAAQIDDTKWKTSIFPSKEMATYILPLKADVRKKEDITADSQVEITITVNPDI